MTRKKLYQIDDQEIDVGYQDCGPFRSYRLDSFGNSLEEMLDNATIAEVDQDGGELDCYDFYGAPDAVQAKALKMINRVLADA